MESDIRSILPVREGSLLGGSLQPTPEETATEDSERESSDRSWNQHLLTPRNVSSASRQGPAVAPSLTIVRNRLQAFSEREHSLEQADRHIRRLEDKLEILSRQQHNDLLVKMEDGFQRNKDSYQELLLDQIQLLSTELCRQSDKIVAVVEASDKDKFLSATPCVPGVMSHPSINGTVEADLRKGVGNEEASAPTMEERPEYELPTAMERPHLWPPESNAQEAEKAFSDEDIELEVENSDENDTYAIETRYKALWGRTNLYREGHLEKQSQEFMKVLGSSHNTHKTGSHTNGNGIDSQGSVADSTASLHQSFEPQSLGRRQSTGPRTRKQLSLESELNSDTLKPCKSNMHFAKDLLFANANQHLDELTSAMQRHDLPDFWTKGKRWVAEPERRSCAAKLLESQFFEWLLSAIIMLNTVFITYSTNYAAKHPENQVTTLMIHVESLFQIFYILELLSKLAVHRLYFFTNKDWLWNFLDCALAVGALYDLLMTQVITPLTKTDLRRGSGSAGANNGFSLTFLRVLRLVRLTKVMRIFRVMRFFSELNVLLKVVSSSLRPLFWCTCMLFVFFYIFAVIFVHGTANCLADDSIDRSVKQSMTANFGSVWRSMLSLMQATTGGADWAVIAEPLYDIGVYYYGLFLFFIVFVILALLNILTGIFVDRAFKAVADDKDGMALEKLHTDRAVVRDLCRLYCAMTGEDIDSTATISTETFQAFMSSPVMRARLAVLDLEIWDSHGFFKMLCSISRSHDVDLQSFVTGCMQLRGQARRLTMQAVHADVQRIKKSLKDQVKLSRTRLYLGSESMHRPVF